MSTVGVGVGVWAAQELEYFTEIDRLAKEIDYALLDISYTTVADLNKEAEIEYLMQYVQTLKEEVSRIRDGI